MHGENVSFFLLGAESGAAAPTLVAHTPCFPSHVFDVPLEMSPVVKALFFLPFSTSHTSKTICCHSLTPPRTTPSARPSTQSKQNAYQFPQLSGSQLPASGMTFPTSLCCPTDVLSASNRKKTQKQKLLLRRQGSNTEKHYNVTKRDVFLVYVASINEPQQRNKLLKYCKGHMVAFFK